MATTYRFLPFARRGLSAALPEGGADGGVLPQRAELDIKVVVANAGEAATKAQLNGPGDVVGIDPQQIVRTYPKAHTTNAEPNFLAALDLDSPELPWLFTPRGVPGSGHLPPWLVLVVVQDRPGVTIGVPRGAPLPQLAIESGAAVELPNLAESWAWAHVQLVESASAPAADLGARLAAQPDRNVARLMCPRRLEPQQRWIAALVPAYDAGRIRGLGGTPAAGPLGPAWSPSQDSVTLPVYFHWEFQTGVEGDFESLAQRLKPHQAALTVGTVAMHVGEGGPSVRVTDPGARIMQMDGALRATAQVDGRIEEVPAALRSGLKEVTRTLADGADGVLDGQTLIDASRQPVGPPVYASAHVRRWQVLDAQNPQDAEWFRELNLDPRARVAAGLGTECIRENQEDIANAAWAQVGDVLAAEAALQRAALSALVSKSFYDRTLAALPEMALLGIAGPMANRMPVEGVSLTAAVALTSLPDAVLDPGLRRALAPAGRAVSRAAKRAGVPKSAVRPGLVAKLAAGTAQVDPTGFARPVLSGPNPDALSGPTLAGIGLAVAAGPGEVERLAASATALAKGQVTPGERLAVRPDVRTAGLLGAAHIDAARELAAQAGLSIKESIAAGNRLDTSTLATVAMGSLLDGMITQAGTVLGASPAGGAGIGFLIEGPELTNGAITADLKNLITVGILDIDAGNTVVVRTGPGQANIPIAVLDPAMTGADLPGIITRLPSGVLQRPGAGALIDRSELPVLRGGGLIPAVPVPVRVPGRLVDRAPGLLMTGPPGAVVNMPIALPADIPIAAPVAPRRGSLPPVVRGGVRITDGSIPINVAVPDPVVIRGDRLDPVKPARSSTVMPGLIRDAAVINRFEAALAVQQQTTSISMAAPVGTLVPFALDQAALSVREHLSPVLAQGLRRDAALQFAGQKIGKLHTIAYSVDGWWSTPALDRVMAYPTFPVAASDYLATYDRTRFCPGVDTVPPDSLSLLETNPRFIGAFMAGLNHEANRELLWRGFPTDSRGTPFRHFWRRLDGKDDIAPVHTWRLGTLAEQTTDPKGNLVLLVRGELLRRYPNTIVVAMPAITDRQPDHDHVITPIFAGQFDPDVSFFGFPFNDGALTHGAGMFFALMEPVTEPRFGLDETKGGPSAGGGGNPSDGLAWPDAEVPEGGHLGLAGLGKLGFQPAAKMSDSVAAMLFQRPFALYIHAKHLLAPLPVQT